MASEKCLKMNLRVFINHVVKGEITIYWSLINSK